MKRIIHSAFFFLCYLSSQLNGQIVVTNVNTPEELVTDVLVGGGILVSNVEFNHDLILATEIQPMVGFFDATGTSFPLSSGLILATGNVNLAMGPNDASDATDGTDVPFDYGMFGFFDDLDLTAIGTETIYHECIIEFDFVSLGDSVSFQYVFASEEYLEYVDAGYNDVFGFFISGPGFSGPYEFGAENIALIPGTDIPVSIDNLNDIDYSEYYVNNDFGLDVQYDGYTALLTANANVICGETYHIKLAIGDAGDDLLDSGVFLKAASFVSNNSFDISIVSASGRDSIIEVCDSALVVFSRVGMADYPALTLSYDISGTAENGLDYNFLDGSVYFPEDEDSVSFWIVPAWDGTAEGTETIVLSFEYVNSCGDTVSAEATTQIIDEQPFDLTLSDLMINCSEDSVLIAFEILEGGVPDFDILWNTGDTGFEIWVPGYIADTSTYFVTVTDACGTEETGEINVILDTAPPTINFDETSFTICDGDPLFVDLTVDDMGDDWTIAWFPSGATTEDLDLPLATGGWHVVAVDIGCVEVSDSIFVTLITLAVDVDLVHESCLGDCSGSASISVAGGIMPYSYSTDGCSTFLDTPVFEDLCADNYTFCVRDSNGCSYSNEFLILPGTDLADASMEPKGPFCLNDSPVTVIAASPGGFFDGPGMDGDLFNPLLAGVGTHSITYSFGGTCPASDTILVVVHPTPYVVFAADVISGCEPLTVGYENIADDGLSYFWDFGDSSTSWAVDSVVHTYNDWGLYTVSLTITDENGCSNTREYVDYITVFKNPVADFTFSPQPTTTIDTEIHFQDQSSGATQWSWSFTDYGSSTDENPTFTYPELAGNYPIDLVVVSEHGCKDSIRKILEIIDPVLIYVPNVFTPDGDNYNNVFLPYLDGIDVDDYVLTIYNRWGEIIFESRELAQGWNGMYGNGLAPDDVYIWQIQFGDMHTDKRYTYDGHVTILK